MLTNELILSIIFDIFNSFYKYFKHLSGLKLYKNTFFEFLCYISNSLHIGILKIYDLY